MRTVTSCAILSAFMVVKAFCGLPGPPGTTNLKGTNCNPPVPCPCNGYPPLKECSIRRRNVFCGLGPHSISCPKGFSCDVHLCCDERYKGQARRCPPRSPSKPGPPSAPGAPGAPGPIGGSPYPPGPKGFCLKGQNPMSGLLSCPQVRCPGLCKQLCKSDYDCGFHEKCCNHGCGSSCQKGV